jgi:glycosyltransferase involved in cell wall biosynthesis
VRILIFHGYLLGGTGSNVYNSRLAGALVRLGHEVHLLCQERHPEQHDFLSAAGDWDSGELRVEELPRAAGGAPGGRATLYRPDLGGLLPVYVADRYEGIEAKTFAECSDEEIAAYISANVAAVREVSELVRPELALANHLVMGPVILARALPTSIPYVVKVHGSALEYTVKPNPDRFLEPAREGLAAARAILVGSRHTAMSLWQAMGEETLPERTRLGPPGVDVDHFAPREPAAAAAGVRDLAMRLQGEAPPAAATGAEAPSAFDRDGPAAGRELARLDTENDVLLAYVGKLILSKGVDLLLAAWPLVLMQVPQARLVVVGFGAYRVGFERLAAALAAGDVEEALLIARAGRSLEGGGAPAKALGHLSAFLEGLQREVRADYLSAAALLPERLLMTGRLDHEELVELLPACEALVAPSTFPEAFGMVAAEAAACGALPVCARHSGLAEVTSALAEAIPPEAAGWLSFAIDDGAVEALADCLCGWLRAEPALRAQVRLGLVKTVRERWSWEGVAGGVIAAAQGKLDTLQRP